jgi:hypothetical protein
VSTLDAIVSVALSATTQVPTEKGFGTPCVAAYHTHNTDRMRSYDDLSGMVTDGYDSFEPGYLAAAAIFAQGLRPVKIGRRASAWTQLVDLVPAAPSSGMIYTITVAGTKVQRTYGGVSLAAECTAIAAAINALSALAADVDAIIATGATTTGSQLFAGALLDGVIGGAAMVPGRYLELVLSSHADWDATTATLIGYDNNGNQITESLAIPNGGNATVNSTKRYARVVSLAIPAQSGTGGTFTLGVRARAVADGSSTTKVRVTAQFAGDLIPYSNHSQDSNIAMTDATADAGIAADLAAIALADPDFYGITLDSNGAAEIEAAAAWAESAGLYEFTAQTADSAVTDTTGVADTTSVAAYVKNHTYFRTVPFFHPTIGANFIAAAILGDRLKVKPGNGPWALRTLAGIAAYDLTSTQLANLRAKNVNTYTVIAGVNATYDGKTAAGEWADVIRFRDWQVTEMQLLVFGAMLNNDGIPMTNEGAEIIGGAMRASLKEGVEAGGIVASYTNDAGKVVPGYSITLPNVDAFTPTQRAARRLINTKFAFRLAGAIIAADITGQVTS